MGLLKDRTPNDLVDWMTFALWRSEARGDEQESLGKWNIVVDDEFEPVFEASPKRERGAKVLDNTGFSRTGFTSATPKSALQAIFSALQASQ
jgi:hypothetical protein